MLYTARKLYRQRAFCRLLGDDIVKSDVPCLKQLLDVYDEYKTYSRSAEGSESEVSKYGIVAEGR